MACRAGFKVEIHNSESAPEVRFLRRDVDGKTLRAVLSPDTGDLYVTVRYWADNLQIPRQVFKV